MDRGSVKSTSVLIGMYTASLVALGVGLLVRHSYPPGKAASVLSASSTNTPVESEAAMAVPADWRTYQDARRDPTGFNLIKFSFSHPPDWVRTGNQWSFTIHGKQGWVVIGRPGIRGDGELRLVREETRTYNQIPVTVTEYRRLKDNVIAGTYWFIGDYYDAPHEAFGFAAEYDASLKEEFSRTFDQVLSSVRFLN